MKSLPAVVVVVACATAPLFAAPPPPPPRPPAAPTSRPSPEQLHALAYQFMAAGQMQRATAPLEQAYRARPLAQQPRELILNHALLDVTQKVNVMRAVKDLREYLFNLPPGQADEHAVDLLGAALQLAGRNPRLAELPLFKTGEKQLHASLEALERARPGMRKWGPKWYDAREFEEIRTRLDAAVANYRAEQQQADRLKVELEAARAEAKRYNSLNSSAVHRHRDPTDAINCYVCIANRNRRHSAEAARANVSRAEADYEAQQLRVEAAKGEIPQPDWSFNLRPLDPAVAPVEPPSAPGPAPTTQQGTRVIAPESGRQ